MSTVVINNSRISSDSNVAEDYNPPQNMDMEEPRSQIRINFDAEFRMKFNREMKRREDKPGRMATMVMTWWLRQPKFVRDLAFNMQDFSENSIDIVSAAVVDLSTVQAEAGQTGQKVPPVDRSLGAGAVEGLAETGSGHKVKS